jgi:hypothetical protein
VNGQVLYKVKLKKNRIFEFEHETGYVIFKFKGFGKSSGIRWEILSVPEGCNTKVIFCATQIAKAKSWKLNSMRGTLPVNEEFDKHLVNGFMTIFAPLANLLRSIVVYDVDFDERKEPEQ